MGKNILMKKVFLIITFLLLVLGFAMAQHKFQISGEIMLENSPLRGAVVQLHRADSDSLLGYTFSNSNGYFKISTNNVLSNFLLKISHVSASDTVIMIDASTFFNEGWHGTVIMNRSKKLMKEIVIRAPELSFKIVGDTISYQAEKYMNSEVNKLEDLLKKMEGFHVDDNGRISFNGKEVSKILIEGDDLTGSKYKVLSKNIDADLVSTVQVINNFNDNRLMKQVENDNNIGINLTIKPDKKNKLNGNLELNYGNVGKGNASLDLVSIQKKLKSLHFINYNNIGKDAAEDISFHWQRDGVSSTGQINQKRISDPIKQIQLPVPPLNSLYVVRNNDFNSTLIESINLSKHVNLKILGSYNSENKKVDGFFSRVYYFPGEKKWELAAHDYSKSNSSNLGSNLLFRIDNTKNRIASYGISFYKKTGYSTFDELRSGFATDYLHEKLKRNYNEIMLEGHETIKFKNKAVLKIDYTKSFLKNTTSLVVQSDRVYTSMLNSFLRQEHIQGLQQQSFSNEFDISINKTIVKITNSIGFHVTHDYLPANAELNNIFNQTNDLVRSNYNTLTSNKTYAYKRFSYRLSKKITINSQIVGGIGKLITEQKKYFTEPIYMLKFSTAYRKTAFKQVGIGFSLMKKPPSYEYFFPSPLLSGNSTMVYGLHLPSFPITKGVELNYLRNNLISGLMVSVTAAAEIINSDNAISVTTMPAYSVTSFFKASVSKNASINFNVEKNIHSLGLKTALATNIAHVNSPTRINEIQLNSSFLIKAVHLNTTSNWKGIFNTELTLSVSNSMLSYLGSTSNNSITVKKSVLKTKFKINPKILASFYVASLKNPSQRVFHALDGICQYHLSKRIKASLTLHNMLNQKIFYERQYGLYSISESKINLNGRIMMIGFQYDF
jgi:hypothetical protein